MMEDTIGPGVLPHRYPFVMLDRVLEVIPGKRAVAEKTITQDGFFKRGRGGLFFPELFLLEAMAQLGAIAAAAGPDDGRPGAADKVGYLAGLHDVKFTARPMPGDRVLFTVEYEARLGGLVRFTGTAKIGDELAAESKLTFTIPA
jgi:3-hydroxyacyl-[acyl-carrier-protein] dehydratase